MKTVVTTNPDREECCDWKRGALYALTIVGVLLIGWALVRAMKSYVPTQAVNANRSQERAAARADLNQKAQADLNGNYAIVNAHNQTVRLPINRAMEVIVQEAQTPEWRAKFLARVDKASTPPPKAPEKPSQFE